MMRKEKEQPDLRIHSAAGALRKTVGLSQGNIAFALPEKL